MPYISCHCKRNVLRWDPAPAPAAGADKGAASPYDTAMICDCSHCAMRRLVWVFSSMDTVQRVKGGEVREDGLTKYTFGGAKLPHYFCNNCGTHLIAGDYERADSGMVGINLRAVRDPALDIFALSPKLNPGPAKGTAYALPARPAGADAYLDKRAKHYDYPTRVYTGGCHCQAVTFAVLCKPLEEVHVLDCSCSICCGNGVLWIYPGRHDIFFHPPLSSEAPYQPAPSLVSRYTFVAETDADVPNQHIVCKTCGCQLFESREPPADAASKGYEGWEEDEGREIDGKPRSFGINAALFNGFATVEGKTGLGAGEGEGWVTRMGKGQMGGLTLDRECRTLGGVYEVVI